MSQFNHGSQDGSSAPQVKPAASIIHKKRSSFRQLISRLLNMFLHKRETEDINEALSIVLSFLKADRICLRLFDEEYLNEIYSCKIKKDGIPDQTYSLPEVMNQKDHIYHEKVKMLAEMICEGKEIVVDSVDELPADLAFAEILVTSNETKSCLLLPIYTKDKVNGYIVVDHVEDFHKWKTSDIENLRVIAEIFSNAIDHERLTRERELSDLRTMKNEVLLNMVFQKLPIGVELYDENGYLTRINRANMEIFDISEEDVIGINLFENPIITEEDKEKIKRGEEAHFSSNYDFNIIRENKYFESKFSGQMKYLICRCIPLKDNNNHIFAYLLLVLDNTDDYSKNKELEYNITKLRMALDTGKALIWEYDVENNKLSFDETLTGDISSWIFMNADNSEMFTSQGQMEGVHPEDTERFYSQAVMPILNGDINQITVTYRQYMGGKLEWLTSNFRSLPSANSKKPSKVFCYSMIVTEQRETELELIKIKEADRLKTVFMENLSHEIRTPLNAIVGFSNIIAETNRTEENEEFRTLINDNNDALLHIVENMLDLSKVDAGEMDYEFNNTDIVQLGQELHDKYSQKALGGVQMKYTYNLNSPEIYIDSKRIRQVVSHLLDNAVKFTQQGQIDLSIRQEKNNLIVSVSDTGIGLTEDQQKQLFVPFYKVDTFQKGTGLGLHISRKLIRGLGGEVYLESEKGKGSKFWFTLPLSNKQHNLI